MVTWVKPGNEVCSPLTNWSLHKLDTGGIFNSLNLDDRVFSVIPAKAGIQKVSAADWIPGLRSATPGMTVNWNISP
jgi:hypothetical protein